LKILKLLSSSLGTTNWYISGIIVKTPQIVSWRSIVVKGIISTCNAAPTKLPTTEPTISTISSMIMGFGWGIAGLTIIGFGAVAEAIGVENTLFYLVYTSGLGFMLTLFLLKVKIK